MSFIGKLKQKFLNSSDSYNFYKKEYELYGKRVTKLEKDTNTILDSYNLLFNTLFLDYEIKPKPLMKNIHAVSIELLKFIDNICKKYDLEWWIDFGNLLGAVRHEGFIPWDDDLDIGMMRKDYDKFVEVVKEEIKENNLDNYIILNEERWSQYGNRNAFLKIVYFLEGDGSPDYEWTDEYDKLLDWIDIFPYDYVENADETTRGTFSDCFKRYRQKMNNNEDKEAALQEYYEKLGVSKEKKDYIIPGLDGTWGEYTQFRILKTDEMFPFIKVNFEGMECSAPNNWGYYLETRYGPDYMSVPKKVFNHNRTDYLRKMDNINQKYETALEKLKEINKIYE